jgi:hypothetical protein
MISTVRNARVSASIEKINKKATHVDIPAPLLLNTCLINSQVVFHSFLPLQLWKYLPQLRVLALYSIAEEKGYKEKKAG